MQIPPHPQLLLNDYWMKEFSNGAKRQVVLNYFKKVAYDEIKKQTLSRVYLNEAAWGGPSFIKLARRSEKLLNALKEKIYAVASKRKYLFLIIAAVIVGYLVFKFVR